MPISIIAAILGGLVAEGIPGLIGAIAGALVAAGVNMALRSAFYEDQSADYDQKDQGSSVRSGTDPNPPWQLVYGRVRKGGKISYVESTGANGFLNIVITLAAHVAEIEQVWFDDEPIPFDETGNVVVGSKWYGALYTQWNAGYDDQEAFTHLVGISQGKWTSAHRQQGHAGIYVLLSWQPRLFPNGIPNITAIVRGRRVYDPRTGLWGYSNNAALCIADYLTLSKERCGFGLPYSALDEAFLIASANVCDEDVAKKDGGTEKRYTCNGSISTEDEPKDIISRMLTSMNGTLVRTGGKWRIIAGAYRQPEVSLDESDLRGPIKIVTLQSRRDLFNGVKGTFVDPDKRWQENDFPAVSSDAYMQQDNGDRIWKDVTLSFTTSHTEAQRISRALLERSRRQIQVEVKLKLGAYVLSVCDVVMFTVQRYGFVNKLFEVMSISPVFEDGELGVNAILRETDPNIYAWTSNTDEGDLLPAPKTTLPDPFNVGKPGIPYFVEELYQTSGSAGVKTKLEVFWDPPQDAFVQEGGQYQLEYKPASLTDFNVLANIRANGYTLNDVSPGLYDFRIKSINLFGASSDYSSVLHAVEGLFAPPTDVSSFSVRPLGGFAHMTWGTHADLDVRIGGFIEVRHTAVGSAAGISWSDSALIDRFNGSAVVGIGPLVQGYYLARALDSTRHYSNSYSNFLVDEVLMTGFTTVNSVVEAPTFPGSKVNLTVSANVLEMTNPSGTTGTYYFPGTPTFYVDCGSAANRRFEADLSLTRFSVDDLMDNRGLIDEWPNVDGSNADAGDALLYVQTTKDDPASSPVWTAWTPFKVAEFNARAARFKLEYETDDATHNIGVTVLNVHIKKAG